MKIQKWVTLLFLLLANLSSTGWTQTLDSLPPGKWWENEKLISEIGLTTEQQNSIHKIVYHHAMGMIDLNAAMKRAELELADLVDRPDFSSDAVRAAFHTFQRSRQELEMSRFEMLLSVRQILSNEQWQQLQQIRRKFKNDNPDMRIGPRHNAPRNGGTNRRPTRPPGT